MEYILRYKLGGAFTSHFLVSITNNRLGLIVYPTHKRICIRTFRIIKVI